jgi:hypothetical protein
MAWWHDVVKYGAPVAGAGVGFFIGGPPGAAAGAMAGSAISGAASADQQARNAREAGQQQRSDLEDAQRRQERAAEQASRGLGESAERSSGYISRAYDDARRDVLTGRDSQLDALERGYQGSLLAYDTGIDKSIDALRTGTSDALSSLDAGYADSRLAQLWNPTFSADPGYEFRLQQGQTALDRMGAASGGRISGAALKKASEYNQGMASQEYGNWFNRMERVGSTLDTAKQNLGIQRSNLQTGLGSALSNIYGQAGQYRSGLASNYATNQASVYGQTSRNLAELSTGMGTNLASIAGNLGIAQANTITGAASNGMNLTMAGLPTYTASLPYEGDAFNAYMGGVSNLTNLGMFYYGSQQPGQGAAAAPADPYGYGDLGRDPSRLNEVYGTSYTPAGYYR